MYSDCTDENRCQGCNQCSCSASGRWECRTVTEGCQETPEDGEIVNEQLIDSALTEMMQQLKMEKEGRKPQKKIFVPKPLPPSETILVTKVSNKLPAWDELESEKEEEEKFAFENLEVRKKRSVENEKSDKKKKNQTITFHHTVDDINEDTLQNTNASGTLKAAKVDLIPIASRRSSATSNGSTSLQIDYTPPLQNQHAADNKIDTAVLHDDQIDLLVHHKIYEIVGNKTQAARDKDLSKLVVNELKSGVTETIGDKESLPISNITFAPENDTLTAMAFIAGNLLNKLWNMEKDNDDSLETDNLKHNKIKDLLELFKEPLNLRQETFLKNALQYLATAIENKSIENSSICENIEELKKNSGIVDAQKAINPSLLEDKTTTETYTKETLKNTALPQIEKKIAAAEALNKINNVLELIKKYERTQNSLNSLKSNINANSTVRKSLDGKNEKVRDLTGEEKTTLTVFGKLLETLTKLILPYKKGKQIRKNVKSKNVLTSDKDFKDKLKKLNLTEESLTTKDKIIVDYLTHIQNNPRCLLNKHLETLSIPEFDGDILQKLSDFFSINTISDLSKLLNGVNKQKENIMRTLTTTFGALTLEETDYTTDIVSRTILTIPTPSTTTATEKDNKALNSLNKFEYTKAKLKDHLKTILQDLVELQNMGGKSVNTKNIEVADALPCIYNLLNDKIINNAYDNIKRKPNHQNKKITDPINKVPEIITSLKNELKRTSQTRRSNVDIEKRPKSAIVWERTVSNLGNINKLHTRRTPQSGGPIFFTDLKTTIDNIESSKSNTYKSIAYLAKVPAVERLLLLKTLALDTTKYITILNDIKQFLDKSTMLPSEQYKYLSEFIETVDNDLNLNGKILNSLDQPKQTFLPKKIEKTIKPLKPYDAQKIVDKFQTAKVGAKLTRDQIINQLIKNRMLLYLKQKEQTGDRKGEINIDLAKKIVLHLEVGDSNLARELFKIFVSQQIRDSTKNSGVPFTDSRNYATNQEKIDEKKSLILEPLVQFEETKESRGSWLDQEQLLKQLMSLKNMRA